jgi:tetratricopeptide (TPR) repeat protein
MQNYFSCNFLKQMGQLALSSLAIATAVGCASVAPPSAPAAAVTAPKLEPLSELMAKAEALAAAENGQEPARAAYRSAAKLYPTNKQPWLKLGESYFASGDYGNAILACQEVIERDPNDKIASGLLAVSGLRVSSKALASLRTDESGLSGDVKSEAKNLVLQLREVVRQSELVPASAPEKAASTVADKPKSNPAPSAAPRNRPVGNPSASGSASTVTSTSGTSAAGLSATSGSAPASGKNPTGPNKSSGNPFDKLK